VICIDALEALGCRSLC